MTTTPINQAVEYSDSVAFCRDHYLRSFYKEANKLEKQSHRDHIADSLLRNECLRLLTSRQQ